jgi:hypothetical protein
MNERSELPFVNAKELSAMSPLMALAMMPWVMSGMMMANAMSFWVLAARRTYGTTWPMADSFDHVGDAPAEELMPHEHMHADNFASMSKH